MWDLDASNEAWNPHSKPGLPAETRSTHLNWDPLICEFYVVLWIIWNMTSRNTDEIIPWFWFQWFNMFVAQGSFKSTWLGSFCASIAWPFRLAALELWRCCWRCGWFFGGLDLTGKSERNIGISHWGDWGCYGFDFLDWLRQVPSGNLT